MIQKNNKPKGCETVSSPFNLELLIKSLEVKK